METINIFSEKYLDFFAYDDETIEFLNKIGYTLDYTDQDLKKPCVRREVLNIIQELLKLDLIYVFHWGEQHNNLNGLNLNTQETIEYIENNWPENAEYPDYFGLVMLGYKEWYMKKMNALGYKPFKTNWNWFVKNKIGDLKKWIENNKPK